MQSLVKKTHDFRENVNIEKPFLPFTESFRKKISAFLFCFRKKMNLELPFLCVEEIYQNLAKLRLYSLVDERSLLRAQKFLQIMEDMGNIIAGGCIVYSLCEHVEKDAVGGIDIYVPTASHVHKTLKVIEETFGEGNIFRIMSYQVANVAGCDHAGLEYSNDTLKFRIFCSKFEYWGDIVAYFDFDYVQCAFFKSTFYLTKDCQRAHSTRRVSYKFYNYISQFAYNKVWKKGFSASNITTTRDNSTDVACEGTRTLNTVYRSAIYAQIGQNDKFSPSNKHQKMEKQKLKDEIISLYDAGSRQFKTLRGKNAGYVNLKLSKLENLVFKENFALPFDSIIIGGHVFSFLVVAESDLENLKNCFEKGLDVTLTLCPGFSSFLIFKGYSYLENLFLPDQ